MSASDPTPATPGRRRLRLRKPTWRGWFTIGVLVVLAGLITAWAIDYGTLGDRVARNVSVEDVDLSRLDGARLAAAFDRADAAYGTGTVEFVIGGRTHSMSAADIGLHLDTDATLATARRVARNDAPLLRPITWFASWFSKRRVPVTVSLDRDKLADALATLPGQTPVVEPKVVGTIDSVGTTPGATGYGFDPDRVARRIEAVARDGTLPLRVPLVAETIEPTVSDAEIELLAERARTLTDRDLTLTIPGATMTATPPVLRSWITSELPAGARHARLTTDRRQVVKAVRQQLGTIVTRSVGATFTVDGDDVLLVPQVNGLRCCALSSGDAVLRALEAGQETLDLPLVEHEPTFTTAKARTLGITTLLGAGLPAGPQSVWRPDPGPSTTTEEGDGPATGTAAASTTTTLPATTTTAPTGPTGSGTGRFVVPIPPRQGQSTNVDRAVPLVRGRIILPGGKLSLNSVIGAPSPARKFVPADVATPDGPTWVSGGGTGLVASALFEAAYEAGLDIPDSTPHGVLPDGVRPGIDATLGWTGPDLVVANPSDHGVLVWADRVAGGVRIRLFGTPFTREVTTVDRQLPFGPHNACLAATVTRTREFLDGRRVDDTFTARYTPPPEARDDPNRVICPG